MNFLLYVIESPSDSDFYVGRSEAGLLSQAAALDGIPCVARTAINRTAFIAALRVGLSEAMQSYPGRFPLLHISAHGSSAGIQLSASDVILWGELRDLLVPVCQGLNGYLILCMSACDGYSACQMAMTSTSGAQPYWALIANNGQPLWSETAVAYATLYHHLSRGSQIVPAVEAMKVASGSAGWVVETAEQSQRAFEVFIAKMDFETERLKLEQAGRSADVPPDAKSLGERASG